MRKIISIITLMIVGLGILNVSIALTGSALACTMGGTAGGHNHGDTAYQREAIPPLTSYFGYQNRGPAYRDRKDIPSEDIRKDGYGYGAENYPGGTGGHSGH